MQLFTFIGASLMMLAALGIFVAILIGIIKVAMDAQKKLRTEWDRAGTALGLQRPASRSFGASAQLEGTPGGLPTSVKGYDGKGARTVYNVGVPFTSLRLTSEGITSAIGRLVSGDDVQTGDPHFDEKALLRGDPHELLALFDAETRTAALEVLRRGGWVGDGAIQLQQSGFQRTGDKLIDQTRALLALANRLAAAEQIPVGERLAAIAAGDPVASVRQNALSSLMAPTLARREVVDAALTRALADPDAGNRLFAATCGRVGLSQSREVLVALVRDPKCPDPVCGKALVALGKLDGVDRPDELLDEILERGGNEARVAAIEALGLRRCDPARVTPFAQRGHAPTRAAVALALERIGNPAAQPLLLALVDDADPAVRLAAIQALGAVADVAAVEKLLPLTRGVFGGDLKSTAQEAVARIQSRAAGAAAGQLSVSDAPVEAGALSAIADEGALSEPGSGPRPIARKTPA